MKFPKSMHAEGWLDHIEKTEPSHLPEALNPNGTAPVRRPVTSMASPVVTPKVDDTRRTRLDTPIAATTPVAAAAGFTAPPSPTIVEPRQPAIAPWVIGAGAGAVLIAVAVMVSRNFAPSVDPVAPPSAVLSEAAKPSPEDAQLAAAPSGAGPVTTPEATQTPAEAPAVTPALPPQPPVTTVAAAPAEPKPAPAPRVQAPAPQQAPVVARTLTPPPETLAQASPPPLTLRDPATVQPATAQPATPETTTTPAPSTMTPSTVTPPTAQPTPSVVPPVAAPDQSTVPPLAQAQPQPQPAVPEDAGITVKVRTALASDTVLAAVPIAVSTDHGVVKLEGQAPDSLARERATVVAAATQGVKGVDNRLTVPPVAQLQQLEPVAKAPGG